MSGKNSVDFIKGLNKKNKHSNSQQTFIYPGSLNNGGQESDK
jgi:hypothetical protein